MPKRDFIKVAKQLYWNHTSAWMFFCKLAAHFQNSFGWLRTPLDGCVCKTTSQQPRIVKQTILNWSPSLKSFASFQHVPEWFRIAIQRNLLCLPVHFMSVIVLQVDVSLKFGTCSITSQWDEFRINNATLQFHILFGICFVLFFITEFVFLYFLRKYQIFAREY